MGLETLGFVPIEEIQNVFTTKLTELEERILPSVGLTDSRPDRTYLLTWFDELKIALMTRARTNLKTYLTQNPAVKAADREARAAEAVAKNKEAWDARTKLGRQYAREGGP